MLISRDELTADGGLGLAAFLVGDTLSVFTAGDGVVDDTIAARAARHVENQLRRPGVTGEDRLGCLWSALIEVARQALRVIFVGQHAEVVGAFDGAVGTAQTHFHREDRGQWLAVLLGGRLTDQVRATKDGAEASGGKSPTLLAQDLTERQLIALVGRDETGVGFFAVDSDSNMTRLLGEDDKLGRFCVADASLDYGAFAELVSGVAVASAGDVKGRHMFVCSVWCRP
jgi:hypothetical protein